MNTRRIYQKKYQIILLTLSYILIVAVFMHFDNAYGSMLDWCSQHAVFPDHFRQLFYDTGDLSPTSTPI